jgi:hypothetical protein
VIEQEWLTSTDPEAMLHHLLYAPVGVGGRLRGTAEGGPRLVSDRSLRLWCGALYGLSSHRYRKWAHVAPWQRGEKAENEPESHLVACSRAWCDPILDQVGDPPMPLRAALLRDIVGNPWRPVLRDQYACPHFAHHARMYFTQAGRGPLCPECPDGPPMTRPWDRWLTPTALRLAEMAYSERGGRVCGECKGDGCFQDERHRPGDFETCEICHGTGRVEDGTLDPVRLLVLADALEEAGCDSWWLLSHLRGEEPCPACLAGPERKRCPRCHEGNVPLRGPHVRGCWAVDLILGEA